MAAEEPPVATPTKKAKERQPSEFLAAAAVAGIAFFAPGEDNNVAMRIIYAVLALAGLLVAEMALEAYLRARAEAEQPKKNAFEVVTKKVDVPTAPPGGIFEAACAMSTHLKGFPVDIKSRVTSTESGFQVLTGTERLRVKVLAGTAIGWEHGSTLWHAKRDEWIKAVQAAPRCAQVQSTEWMGVTSLVPAAPVAVDAVGTPQWPMEAGATCVKIDGVEKKPQLNGKLALVTRAANEAGRVGVRPEGQKESVLLASSKLTPLPPFDARGVSIPCLRTFRASLEPMLKGLTVAEAIDSVLKPLTFTPKCSVAAALSRKAAQDEAGKPYVAPATVYVCHADAVLVSDLFDVVEKYAAAQPDNGEGVYVWLSLLCVDHHGPDQRELPMLWWQHAFRAGLKAIGSTCVVLHPWDDAATLKDSWCHWTLHTALVNAEAAFKPPSAVAAAAAAKEAAAEGKPPPPPPPPQSVADLLKEVKMYIGITEAQSTRLDAALVANMEAPMKVLDTRLDGWRKSAEAPTAAQHDMIERAIEKSEGGYDEFGRRLADVLHKWLLDRAKGVLDALPADERATSTLVDRVAKLLQDFGDLEAAEPLCREQVEGRAKALGETHSDTLEAINNLALLLHQLGKLEEAEPYSKRKLAGCRATLGDRHPDTITAIDTTSQLLSDLGKLGDALPLKRESLLEKRRTLGDRHPDTLLSVNNLAVLLNDLGRNTGDLRLLREAEPLKREALAGCREVLGNRHPHTLASVANLADLLMQLAPADPRAIAEAEPLARESLAGCREVLGNGHPETLKSVGMLATLMTEAGHLHPPKAPLRIQCFKEAEPLYREAVQGFTRGLGPYHPTPLSYHHELARLLLDMDKVSESESLSRDCLSGCRASLGDSHPETLIAITHLAAVLRQREQYGEAIGLAREVRDGWRNLEMSSKAPPRNTLTATNILAELLHATGKNAEAEPLVKEVLAGFLRAVGPKHPFTISAAENLSNVLRALHKGDEADKVLKQFGMKTPLPGGIAEGDEDEASNGGSAPPANGSNGKAKAKAKAKDGNGKAAAASPSSPKASPQTSPKKNKQQIAIDEAEDVD